MTQSGIDSATITWHVPECPFTIESSARTLDDIRLAVMDAFFSLPRGGAEIGGILLGTFENARLVIAGYAALDCEHAYGPSFTLSPPDEARLEQLLSTHGARRSVVWRFRWMAGTGYRLPWIAARRNDHAALDGCSGRSIG